MWKKNKPKFEKIKICKYCSSLNITQLTTSGGFGGGDVYITQPYGFDVFLCINCGKITHDGQFEKKEMKNE